MNSLRVGVSGTGALARSAALQVRLHTDCDLVAVHGETPAAAQAFAREHHLGFATADYSALLGYGVDFVLLTGPLAERLPQVTMAAEQGAHVLLGAPFAADLASARTMAARCEAAGVKLGVATPEFADPVLEQLRHMLVAGWLGGAVAVQVIAGNGMLLQPDPSPATLDPLWDLASPYVHLVSWLLGRSTVQVAAQITRVFRADMPDGAAATAQLRGGVLATFLVSRLTLASAFAVHGTDGGMRLAGDRIWLRGQRAYEGPVFDYRVPGREVSLGRDELAAAIAAASARTELCGRFARWIEDCDDYPCPAEQALLDLEVVDAMCRAASTGDAIDV